MCERHREQSPPHRDAVECRIEQAAAVDADRTERDELVPSVRLEQACGNSREALASLDSLARLAERRHFTPHLVALGAAVRAQMELAQGNVAAAIRWADTSCLSAEDDDLCYRREGACLALARVRIAQGRDDPVKSLLSLAIKAVTVPPRQRTLVYVTCGPDQPSG